MEIVYGGGQVVRAGMKPCANCERWRPVEEFREVEGTRTGVGTYCRPCRLELNRRRERNSDKVEAYNAARRRPPLEPIECPGCGVTFAPPRRDSSFCSKSCRRRARLAAARLKQPMRVDEPLHS